MSPRHMHSPEKRESSLAFDVVSNCSRMAEQKRMETKLFSSGCCLGGVRRWSAPTEGSDRRRSRGVGPPPLNLETLRHDGRRTRRAARSEKRPNGGFVPVA